MSAVDDVARMLALVPWLLERPGATVQETAAVFGVAESKVREDLYHLDFCGLPGLGGGDLFDVSIVADRIVVSMADELREPLRLTPVEALRLVLIAEAVRDAVAGDLPELDGAIAKLRAAADVPRGVSVELDDTGARWLVPIRRAIESDRTVTFAYRGRADDAPQSRTVDPWGLTVAEGFWYVQGHDHGDRKTCTRKP